MTTEVSGINTNQGRGADGQTLVGCGESGDIFNPQLTNNGGIVSIALDMPGVLSKIVSN